MMRKGIPHDAVLQVCCAGDGGIAVWAKRVLRSLRSQSMLQAYGVRLRVRRDPGALGRSLYPIIEREETAAFMEE